MQFEITLVDTTQVDIDTAIVEVDAAGGEPGHADGHE
jgi:hypothetical protein